MRIEICCPSYKRAANVETLKYIPECKVYVDGSEYDKYQEENPKANIVRCDDGIQGNVARVRNYILNKEFGDGADAVCIVDDDMRGIYRFDVDEETKYGYKRVKLEKDMIPIFLDKYTRLCAEFGYKLWGLNVNMDSLSYRHYSPFSMSSIILGPFCVHLNNPIRYDERLPLKEDYDIAIQHLNIYRGILRLNGYNYDVKQSENKGGCAAIRNLRMEKEQFDLLQKKWGEEIVREDTSNKGGTKKVKRFDYNPIIKVPIKGI